MSEDPRRTELKKSAPERITRGEALYSAKDELYHLWNLDPHNAIFLEIFESTSGKAATHEIDSFRSDALG